MKISSIIFDFTWWKTELNEHPENHVGPAYIFGATTFIVTAVWGKFYALAFVGTSAVTYPWCHRQIAYLMYLDVQETAYAVAIVGVQLINMQFPHLSQVSLFLSVVLAYVLTIRGIKLRQILHNNQIEIEKLNGLNTDLKKQTDALDQSSTELGEALATLNQQIFDRSDLRKKGQTLNEKLQELKRICQSWISEKEQIKQLDENDQKIAFQTALISGNISKLSKLTEDLKTANEKLQSILAIATQDEKQVQEGLKQFQDWLTTLLDKHRER